MIYRAQSSTAKHQNEEDNESEHEYRFIPEETSVITEERFTTEYNIPREIDAPDVLPEGQAQISPSQSQEEGMEKNLDEEENDQLATGPLPTKQVEETLNLFNCEQRTKYIVQLQAGRSLWKVF